MRDTAPDSQRIDPPRAIWTIAIPLAAITAVWLAGAIWSFGEQTDFAHAKAFRIPQLLPLVFDGLAFSMAATAWSAVLDGRSAGSARLGTLLAIGASAASNAAWAWERSHGRVDTVTLAAAVPVVANVAFEVLLGELRRRIQRKRGLPPPVPVPAPRLVRLVLSPWSTYIAWRRLVLAATDPALAFAAVAASRDARQRAGAPTLPAAASTAERTTAVPVLPGLEPVARCAEADAQRPAAPPTASPDAQQPMRSDTTPTNALPDAQPPAPLALPQRIALRGGGELSDDMVIEAIQRRVEEAHRQGASPSQRELQQLVTDAHPGAPRPGPRRLQRLVEQIIAGGAGHTATTDDLAS